MKTMALSLIVIAACAAAPAVPRSRAETVAALLVRVDAASGKRGMSDRMAGDVAALDRLGVQAADASDDPRPGWHRASGTRATPVRGRLLGPAFRRGWIDPGGTATLQQQFLGGQKSNLAVAATPSAALMLDVTDPANTAMCRSAAAHCSWIPIFTQRYTILLHNAGAERVRFYLVID